MVTLLSLLVGVDWMANPCFIERVPGKPHITWNRTFDAGHVYVYWSCDGPNSTHTGRTPQEAYDRWKDWQRFLK